MNTALHACNIAEFLKLRAQENPDLLAIAEPLSTDSNGLSTYKEYSYKELNALCEEYIKGLYAIGIRKGMRCVLMVKPSLEFFAFTFALLRMGAILVAIDPGMGIKNIKTCLEEAEPNAFIGIGQAHIAKLICRWPRMPIQIWSTSGDKQQRFGIKTQHHLCSLAKNSAFPELNQSLNDDAAILFTSGSTGVPKGVTYTHEQFVCQVNELQSIFHIEVGERDLCTFPLFALFAPALGMSSYIPDMDFTKPGSVNPLHVLTPVTKHKITNMFGSPALIKRVAQHTVKHPQKLQSLKRVISAGAPARPDVLKQFSQLLNDDVEIFTPYGATESLPVSNIGSHDIINKHKQATDNGKGVCVGTLAPHITVRIIRITDEAIANWRDEYAMPANSIGEITVQGPVVSQRYFNRPASTQLAKIRHGTEIIHRMGDIGYLDEENRLWFLGRKGHRVESHNRTYFSIACEAIFNQHEAIERSALIRCYENGDCIPGICVELKKSGNLNGLHADLIALAQQHDHCKDITRFYIHPSFPVDIRHNAKINRELLSEWAQNQKALKT